MESQNHNHDQNNSFYYTYSAPRREEVERIRRKYQPKEEDKMAELLRLDRSVSQKGVILSLVVGMIGALLLGIGMCCAMVWGGYWLFVGIPVGLCGIAGIASAYPLYVRVTKKEREKVAPEILRLTEELLRS